ncbi:hypothetical protein [Thalassovita aquimarina]|uniref:Pre ATP-grasp domain-containing protein n=1 Tax=Thalassovita aquimarina TaxID=2785917 RepID=A0ABS5HRE1_9RHOB|nr:hypothetical protein [Thalassovita aquimarina]
MSEGDAPGPYVFFGDAGEIPLLDRPDNVALEYRLSMLAGDGDLVVLGSDRNVAFEEYKASVLNLGQCRYLPVRGRENGRHVPVHIRCLNDVAAFDALAGFVSAAGGVTLVPHIATGAIWALARKLARDTGKTVHVAGPPPAVTRFANDKMCFSELVRALFGPYSGMSEVSAHGMAALVGRVREMARGCDKIVLKLPSSAGSAGNFPIFSNDVVALSPMALWTYLQRLIGQVVMPPEFPMIVQVWENNVLSSPSVQLWIPRPEAGDPVIEGLFEQVLTGAGGQFAGARPLPGDHPRIADLCHEGAMLGLALQAMGYFGRCSFDAVLTGDSIETAALHWIECNGRWGGVSVPMTLLNRLFGEEGPPSYAIMHNFGQGGGVAGFADGLEVLGDLIWRPGRDTGIIFNTPSGFEAGTSFHFVALASSDEAATDLADVMKRRLAPGANPP